MTICYFIEVMKILHYKLTALDAFSFDNINIRPKGIVSQNPQQERRVIISKSLLGPFRVFRKIKQVQGFVLIQRVWTCLRRGIQTKKNRQGKHHTRSSEPTQKGPVADNGEMGSCLAHVHRKFAR